MLQPLVGMDLAELGRALGPGQPGFRARQVYQAVYQGRRLDIGQITTLPARLREELAARFTVGLPDVARLYESSDGTRRYLLRLADGQTIETVRMPEGERETLCISSQAGCAVGCTFCMTALLGLERNLTAGEIAGQVLRVWDGPPGGGASSGGFDCNRVAGGDGESKGEDEAADGVVPGTDDQDSAQGLGHYLCPARSQRPRHPNSAGCRPAVDTPDDALDILADGRNVRQPPFRLRLGEILGHCGSKAVSLVMQHTGQLSELLPSPGDRPSQARGEVGTQLVRRRHRQVTHASLLRSWY